MITRLLIVWRVSILLILGVIARELWVMNRELRDLQHAMPDSSEVAGVEERLDTVHKDLEDLWQLTNELVK